MKKKNLAKDDKYLVEATSARDLDGCGTTEATGLIPFLPQSGAELNSYKSILPFSPHFYLPFLFLQVSRGKCHTFAMIITILQLSFSFEPCVYFLYQAFFKTLGLRLGVCKGIQG